MLLFTRFAYRKPGFDPNRTLRQISAFQAGLTRNEIRDRPTKAELPLKMDPCVRALYSPQQHDSISFSKQMKEEIYSENVPYEVSQYAELNRHFDLASVGNNA